MGWEPGNGKGTGDEPGPGVPGPDPQQKPARDHRLAGFARGGQWDTCPPGPELAALLAAVAGPDWRCPGAGPGELTGVLRRLAALESWASAAKLAAIRAAERDVRLGWTVPRLSRDPFRSRALQPAAHAVAWAADEGEDHEQREGKEKGCHGDCDRCARAYQTDVCNRDLQVLVRKQVGKGVLAEYDSN